MVEAPILKESKCGRDNYREKYKLCIGEVVYKKREAVGL